MHLVHRIKKTSTIWQFNRYEKLKFVMSRLNHQTSSKQSNTTRIETGGTPQRNATQCNAMQCNAMQCNAMQLVTWYFAYLSRRCNNRMEKIWNGWSKHRWLKFAYREQHALTFWRHLKTILLLKFMNNFLIAQSLVWKLPQRSFQINIYWL